jgi:hypothetical protein
MGCCDNIEDDDKKVCIQWLAALGVVGLIAGAFCLGFSFNIVELNETAIVEETYSPKLYFDSKYDDSGYYLVGKTSLKNPVQTISRSNEKAYYVRHE